MTANTNFKIRLWPAVFSLVLVTGLLSIFGMLLLVATIVDLSSDYANLLARVSSFTTMMSAFMFLILLTFLIYINVCDTLDGVPRSAMLAPITGQALFMSVLLVLSSIAAMDRTLHETPHWRWIADPDVRLLAVIAYIGIVACFAWLLAVLLHGRGLPYRRIAALYVGMIVITASFFFAALAANPT